MKFRAYLVATLLVFARFAMCQDEFVPDKGQTPAEPTKDDPEKEIKEKVKKYDDFLKDAKKFEGAFTLYAKEKDGKTDVYVELSPEQLGKYWFLQATLQSGVNPYELQAGEPLNANTNADAFRFERHGDDMWLMVPNLNWRWAKDSPWAIAASRSFPEGVIDDYKIEFENPKTKKMLVKLTDLFYGTVFGLNEKVNDAMSRPYQLDRGMSSVSEVKAFPENVVVRTKLYFNSPSAGGSGDMPPGLASILGGGGKSHLADDRSLPLAVTYLMYPQRADGFISREADDRVGYFTQDYFDHAKIMDLDKTTRLIYRWNLKKKDPSAALSEPVEPIIWYIDDSVPPKYRKACADGILRWNKAFEAIGYKNAVVVKMKPEGADWDHADMRYNVVRIIQSEKAAYAVAQVLTDPFTGEIRNACISLDASMIADVGLEYQWLTAPAQGSLASSLKKFTRQPPAAPIKAKQPFLNPGVQCRLAEGKLQSAAFAWAALSTIPGTSRNRDEYICEFVSDVISHEAGHCFGLRHNFVASTYLSDADLADQSVTNRVGNSASVMDYVPVNMPAVAKGKGDFYSRSIGPYDIFAIEYGYRDVPGKTAEGQHPYLLKIAAKGALPGNLYMTDENADSFDPYVVRFDHSKNPIENAALTIGIAKKLLGEADKMFPKPGRPYSDLTRIVNASIVQTVMQSLDAARFVGGVSGRRNFAGDAGEKPTLAPVDPALQRQAIQLIARQLLSEDAFKLSPRILLNLSSDPNGEYSDFPIKTLLTSAQAMVLATVLSGDTIDRVANNAYKTRSQAKPFTLQELYDEVDGAVFSEIGTMRAIGPLRRDLQRFLVDGLIEQATARPGMIEEDARMLAAKQLRDLSKRLAANRSKDSMTVLHGKDLKLRIDKALKRA
ncbi:MAG TPA: zinc-dependent metalloprotease [Fimbriimonadales bacterium]|jgi:hypothetical protein|nr:zinc-dependent metalloprotease [Fimbriimonadales bacterium]